MKTHHVSRSVIREAMSQLQARGRVQTRHGVGTFATESEERTGVLLPPVQSIADVISVMEVRISLEAEAAAFAASRRSPAQIQSMRALLDQLAEGTRSSESRQEIDQQFHLAVTQAAHNRYLLGVLQSFSGGLIPRMKLNERYLDSGRSAYFLQRRDAEHEQLFLAIVRQDAVAAAAAMRLHLSNSRERLIEICDATAS